MRSKGAGALPLEGSAAWLHVAKTCVSVSV